MLAWKAAYFVSEKEYAVKSLLTLEAVSQCGWLCFEGDYKQLFKEVNEQSKEMIFCTVHRLMDWVMDISFRYGTRSSFGSCWNNIW